MKLKDLLKHRYTGHLLRISLVLVLLFSVVHVYERKQTLENQGCQGYWNEFHGVNDFSSKTFLSTEERKNLLNGRKPDIKDEWRQENFSYTEQQR